MTKKYHVRIFANPRYAGGVTSVFERLNVRDLPAALQTAAGGMQTVVGGGPDFVCEITEDWTTDKELLVASFIYQRGAWRSNQ